MNNKTNFEKLCRYIWQENPHDFIAVRVNPVAVDEGRTLTDLPLQMVNWMEL